MGKSLPSTTLQNIARIASEVLEVSKFPKSKSKINTTAELKPSNDSLDRRIRPMESRVPLSEVVSDCVRRWFQDTLREARAGDSSMQVLVGQMYYSGYGISRDRLKGRAWMTKASRTRSSVWKVSDKHPGYNASDSDSDELKDNSK